MSLASATVNSVNTVYAQLIEQLGADKVVETAERMGMRCCARVSEPRAPLSPYLSAVLGTNEANTLEMASAYGTLATGGAHVDPTPVISVDGPAGRDALAGASRVASRCSIRRSPRWRPTSCRTL